MAILLPTRYSNPSTPPSYLAGAVKVAFNKVSNLMVLIQAQLAPNCPGAAHQVRLTSNRHNDDITILIGAASVIGGPLSKTNYGVRLAPGQMELYLSSYPGASAPIGDLQVLVITVEEEDKPEEPPPNGGDSLEVPAAVDEEDEPTAILHVEICA